MEIEILEFEKDAKGFKIGICDVKIIYSPEKEQIFRNIAVFNKENKKWISFPKTKRGEKWLDLYTQTPPLDKTIYPKILEILENNYL